jgi:hypothetical protein
VKLNPCYDEWSADVAQLPVSEKATAIFMLAATWPDKIKNNPHGAAYDCQPGHTFIKDGGAGPNGKFSVDIPSDGPEASQNVGYDDDRRHQYWHFIDLPFSNDGTPTRPPYTPNAVTEIVLLTTAIGTDEADAVKSYDLAWLEHLVGDVHQPLHDTTRFTLGHPNGDQGGNLVLICGTPNCKTELHAYWDQLPGPGNDLSAAIDLGEQLDQEPIPDGVDETDPNNWANEGFELAKTVAYAPPVTDDAAGSTGSPLGKTYRAKAVKTMDSRLSLAGHRLAQLLNTHLH